MLQGDFQQTRNLNRPPAGNHFFPLGAAYRTTGYIWAATEGAMMEEAKRRDPESVFASPAWRVKHPPRELRNCDGVHALACLVRRAWPAWHAEA